LLLLQVVGYSPFAGDDVTDQLGVCQRIAAGVVEWPEEELLKESSKKVGRAHLLFQWLVGRSVGWLTG